MPRTHSPSRLSRSFSILKKGFWRFCWMGKAALDGWFRTGEALPLRRVSRPRDQRPTTRLEVEVLEARAVANDVLGTLQSVGLGMGVVSPLAVLLDGWGKGRGRAHAASIVLPAAASGVSAVAAHEVRPVSTVLA